jgi:ABC-type oligopeptide transport system substrate-binding subunit
MFGHNSSHWLERHDIEKAVAWWNLAMMNSTFVHDINGMEGYIDIYTFPTENVVRKQLAILTGDSFDMVLRHHDVNLTGLIRHHGPNEPPIRIRVNPVSWGILWNHVFTNKVPMWTIGWKPEFADPYSHSLFFVHSEWNGMAAKGYSNETIDDWVIEAIQPISEAERLEIYNKIQKQVAYDQPSIYMLQNKQFTVRRSWLKGSGLAFNPMHEIYWYHIYKE